MDYSKMTLDELIDVLHSAVEDDVAGPGQHAAADRLSALHDEILKRDGAMQRYRALLSDPSPQMRYNAALAVQSDDPDTAYGILKALVAEPKSGVKLKSRIALYQLQDSGRLTSRP